MSSFSTRLRRVPVIGGVVDLPFAERVIDELPFASRGLAYGAVAFGVGYGLLYWLVDRFFPPLPGAIDFLLDVTGISLPGTDQIAGWVFYMAHGIPIYYPTEFSSTTGNFLSSGMGKVLFVYPPLVLVIAGIIAARNERDLRAGVVNGASIAVGYALVFVVFVDGLYWKETFVRDFEIWVVQGSDFLPRAVGYPLVFGALGGVVAVTVLDSILSRIPLVSRLR